MAPLELATTPGSPRPRLDLSEVGVCAPHGEPAVRRATWRPQWRPLARGEREWKGGLIRHPFGYGSRVFERIAQTVHVDATGWPLCARCARTRDRWMRICAAVFGLGVACVVGTLMLSLFVLDEPWPPVAVVFAAGLLAVFASLVPLRLGSWERLTDARTTPDGRQVQVEPADPRFVEAVRAR